MKPTWLRRSWVALACGGCLTLACGDDDSPVTTSGAGSAGTAAGTNGGGSSDGSSSGAAGTTGGGSSDGSSSGSAATDSGGSTGDADSSSAGEQDSGSSESGGPGSTGGSSSGSGDDSESGSSTGGFEVEGCGMCNAGEVCRANLSQQTDYECVPIPARCEAEANCDCAASLCEDPFVSCNDRGEANSIACICIAC